MDTNTNSKAFDEPSNNAAISIDMSKIDGNTKAYIDVACQNSANVIIASIKAYIDQHAANQSATVNKLNHKEKQADQGSSSQQGNCPLTSLLNNLIINAAITQKSVDTSDATEIDF
ncbi:hypothetical protein C2G38_2226590 [Gigaspora rosea]|uniref:Uncharacterized protein n=1 Tax=Gigaspora rosea TaxID=44941 RepID=A0A397TZR0_9GLOM|nr:hypothetical protein C2G38_2226590 [Gigaspora rosea]